MRRRIHFEILQNRFDTAWNCIPAVVKRDLRGFIRYVDGVPELLGTCISVRDNQTGSVEVCEGPIEKEAAGFCYFYSDSSREFCDVILPNDPIGKIPEAPALAIILHELAHAHDYYIRRNDARDDNEAEAEIRAWRKAIEWATMAPLANGLSNDLALYAQCEILRETLIGLVDRNTQPPPDG